jgi:hypothetical protein
MVNINKPEDLNIEDWKQFFLFQFRLVCYLSFSTQHRAHSQNIVRNQPIFRFRSGCSMIVHWLRFLVHWLRFLVQWLRFFVHWLRILLTWLRFFLTLTEVFPCVFLSCKTNARVKLAKTGHGPHSSTLFIICVVQLLFVLFSALFLCKCVPPPGDNPIALNKYSISYLVKSAKPPAYSLRGARWNTYYNVLIFVLWTF